MTWPGCQVTIAPSGEEALRRFAEEPPDLVVLDVSMPPPDGIEVCRRIRAISQVPILMLTVRDATLDKVHALDLGADDYLTKPFDPLELFARLRALLRRRLDPVAPATAAPAQGMQIGTIAIDFMLQQVRVGGEPVQLTSIEYRVLEELMRHAGQVLSHQYLLERVWGPAYTRETHYLKGIVRRLRQKLGDDADTPHYIQTVWGDGYRFLPPH
ncbi:MAG TPA: response regulator transcription factor [Herpetosiphonaceae bacterium]|nr:response regulator transcription factor [Herpetosiphonaceae bacterium]